jgi:hypothetical protein
MLVCASLMGCRSTVAVPSIFEDDRETGEGVEVTMFSDPDGGPLPTRDGPLEETVKECLERICSPRFRQRAVAHQTLLELGKEAIPLLCRAHDEAPVGSRKQRTILFILERIQRQNPPKELIREVAETVGVRQIAAVRAAAHLGLDAVPTLLSLLTHHDPAVRKNVIIVLRRLTARHPSLTGRGPVHAIRVWRRWYKEELKKRARSRPKNRPNPTPPPGAVVPEITVSVKM